MAGRKGGQKKSGKAARIKTTGAGKNKNPGWLRSHLGGILLAFSLLFFLGATLLVMGYVVLLSY